MRLCLWYHGRSAWKEPAASMYVAQLPRRYQHYIERGTSETWNEHRALSRGFCPSFGTWKSQTSWNCRSPVVFLWAQQALPDSVLRCRRRWIWSSHRKAFYAAAGVVSSGPRYCEEASWIVLISVGSTSGGWADGLGACLHSLSFHANSKWPFIRYDGSPRAYYW